MRAWPRSCGSPGCDTPVREFGIAPEFLEHGTRAELLEQLGLTPQEIARYAVEAVVRDGRHTRTGC